MVYAGAVRLLVGGLVDFGGFVLHNPSAKIVAMRALFCDFGNAPTLRCWVCF